MWGGLDDTFRSRLQAFVDASGGQIRLLSGFRDNDHQQDLYNQAVAEHGAANAGKWAAPPGRSNHNRGTAGDLRFVGGASAKKWAHENAARFGLEFPMSWEPWHIEPVGLRTGHYKADSQFAPDESAYTTPPPGFSGAMENLLARSTGGALDALMRGAVPSLLERDDGSPVPGVLDRSTGEPSASSGPGASIDAMIAVPARPLDDIDPDLDTEVESEPGEVNQDGSSNAR